MKDLLGDLRWVEKELEDIGYDIDHYEIREPVENPAEDLGYGGTRERAEGVTAEQAISEWTEIGSEDYVIEVFLGGKNFMDRVIYEPGEELEYISFSHTRELDLDELLES